MPDSAVVGSSIDDLLAGASRVTTIESAGKSGARLDRVMIGGEPYVVKYLDATSTGPCAPRASRAARSSSCGGAASSPSSPTASTSPSSASPATPRPTVAAADARRRGVAGARTDDAGPARPAPAVPGPHGGAARGLLGDRADIDVVSPTDRYLELSPRMAAAEAALGSDHLVPRLVAQGWPLFAEVAPAPPRWSYPLAARPGAAGRGAGDARRHARARQLEARQPRDRRRRAHRPARLGDCPAAGAGLSDLAWYLAINCRRLPTRRRRRSTPTARRSSGTASHRRRGGTASSGSA